MRIIYEALLAVPGETEVSYVCGFWYLLPAFKASDCLQSCPVPFSAPFAACPLPLFLKQASIAPIVSVLEAWGFNCKADPAVSTAPFAYLDAVALQAAGLNYKQVATVRAAQGELLCGHAMFLEHGRT